MHAAPLVPQLAGDGFMHVFPEQQPLGQETESQTQAPLIHLWPPPHAGPVPHVQVPFVQVSACVGSQVMQDAPPVPQLVGDGATHVFPEQQPLGQEPESQTPEQLPTTEAIADWKGWTPTGTVATTVCAVVSMTDTVFET